MQPVAGAEANRLLAFTLPQRSARGRVVRLGSVLDEILGAHKYPDKLAQTLAETLALTAILGALFRSEDGQLTLQARSANGQLRMLVADFKDWAVRGYACLNDDVDPATLGDATLETLLGAEGHLVLTLDQTNSNERYQGIVPLDGGSLEASAQSYFEHSEQLPTIVRLAAAKGIDGRWRAGGLLLQQLASAEVGGPRLHVERNPEDWAHVAALGGSVRADELLDDTLSHEALLWRLFNEDEVRIQPSQLLTKGCRCSIEHIREVLSQFPEAERAPMRNAAGEIVVDCEFCAKSFALGI